jgi:dihydroorotate dehydrogenase
MRPELIGVGGIATADDVKAHLAAGAQAVHLASAAMLDPAVGLAIRRAYNEPIA